MTDTQTTRFRVEGMDCASCAAKVSKAAKGVEGVQEASVYVTSGTLVVNVRVVVARVLVGELEYGVHDTSGVAL